jgi:(2Fe-2S) ferredoxin
MSKAKYQVADFQIQGQLLGFILKDGYKIKYLKIAFEQREYWIKLPKDLRNQINQDMVPGCWLDITGSSKKCRKTGKLKLRAVEVKLVKGEESDNKVPATTYKEDNSLNKSLNKSSKIRILVCNKSSCRKRGSSALCQELQSQIKDYGLQENTEIKLTGCLKKCKKGPNLVITPAKARYSEVTPEQIPVLFKKHLSL